MNHHQLHTFTKLQKGSSLLEVLISMVVLGIGILGLLALQTAALKTNQLAVTRTLASGLAMEVSELMRANKTAAESGAYNIRLTDTASSATTIAEADLKSWKSHLAQLPSGQGSISRTSSVYTITIQWDESRTENGNAHQQFVYKTEL